MLRVLIAGGGVAGIEAMLALRALAEERVEVELLAPESAFAYRPMVVAEPFGTGEVRRFDLEGIAAASGASLTRGLIASIDAARHVVRTSGDVELDYDVLLIACGARPREGIPGALTFGGPEGGEVMRALFAEIEAGAVGRVAFALPGGVSWTLPLYELALQTADRLGRQGVEGVELVLVTPEEAPLEIFGGKASEAIRELLAERGIALQAAAHPASVEGGGLILVPAGVVEADRVVTLPRLAGPSLAGVPRTAQGFIPTDAHGRVIGRLDVYAAGDATAFPVKQGGIAAQQADAVAEAIAARAGADVTPTPFEPVLRGLLLTGAAPAYLRAELGGGHGETSEAGAEALWWPPAKIVGRYLTPFLAANPGLVVPAGRPAYSSSSRPSEIA